MTLQRAMAAMRRHLAEVAECEADGIRPCRMFPLTNEDTKALLDVADYAVQGHAALLTVKGHLLYTSEYRATEGGWPSMEAMHGSILSALDIIDAALAKNPGPGGTDTVLTMGMQGSDGEEVRSLVVGGAQVTQAGGDSGGMPLSVGRSRPDQTAILQRGVKK
jgi:hypothetical protein